MSVIVRYSCAALIGCGVLLASPVEARQKFITGVFTATENGVPIELIAWAESQRSGVFRMANDHSLEDAPVLPRTYRFLVNTGIYVPIGVLATTGQVFSKALDILEYKRLAYSSTRLGVSTYEIGVPELEDWTKVQRLRKSLKASDEHPAIFFLMVTNGTIIRYYPFFIDQ